MLSKVLRDFRIYKLAAFWVIAKKGVLAATIKVYKFRRVYFFRLVDSEQAVGSEDLELVFRLIDQNEAVSLAKSVVIEFRKPLLTQFDRELRCFGGWHHGELVYISWIDFKAMLLPEYGPIELPGDCAYITNLLTASAWRGKKINQAALRAMR